MIEGGFADTPSPSAQHTAGKGCSCHLDSLCRKVGGLRCAKGGLLSVLPCGGRVGWREVKLGV